MKKNKHIDEEIMFFINEKTPDYWKFMFLLVDKLFSTSKIILISLIIFLFIFHSKIYNNIKNGFQYYSQQKIEKIINSRQDKIDIISNFKADETYEKIQKIYNELETTKNYAEKNIQKQKKSLIFKNQLSESLNNSYNMLIVDINKYVENQYKAIAISRNPNNLNIDNVSNEELQTMVYESLALHGKFFHSFDSYITFNNLVNLSLIE